MSFDTTAYSESYGVLQRLVNEVFEDCGQGCVTKMDIVCRASIDDLDAASLEVVDLLPSGTYTRVRLCDQMNSIITAHGWGYTLGTVE